MRGVHSAVDEIRRNVFTEVARLAYEGGDLKRVDMIPYTIVPGEVARHRHDVFLERAIVQERVRLALGMSLQPAGEQTPVSAGIQEAAAADDKYFEEPLVNIISFACHACPPKHPWLWRWRLPLPVYLSSCPGRVPRKGISGLPVCAGGLNFLVLLRSFRLTMICACISLSLSPSRLKWIFA